MQLALSIEEACKATGLGRTTTYAHMTAVPKLLTWVRFLDWLMPKIETLPPSLIPELVPIFKTWQDSCSGQNIRHCREIVALSYKWLQEIESSSHPTKWSDYRRPFNGELNRDIEKPIRALFLTSAGDSPDLSKEYLRNRVADKQHVHMFRTEILQNSASLVRYIAADFVDFMLEACLEYPDDREDPFGSFSDHVFQELGISHDFYPASPLQPPFLTLLKLNEPEGLRLIHGFCNHSIRIWKKSKEASRRHPSCLTPVPITLEFPWGTQSFWGDNQVYLWFRGEWGSDGARSALMALEQWALDEIQNGRNFSEIFKKVVDGNETVAALGIAVSLCIAFNCASPECALPLVTCTHLQKWDLIRSVQIETPMPSNEIGNWHQDRHYLQAVLASPEWTSNKNGEYLDREFTSCAISALFCGSQDFAPMVCGIDPSWPNLDRFLSIIERAVKEFGQNETLYFAVTTFLKAGGFDLMPAPALQWLHILITGKKGATRFWNLNGEETVVLLRKVLSEKKRLITTEDKRLIKEIADVLIDCGVRGAGFLQQEILRT